MVDGNEAAPAGLDTTTVHPARRYNYWLGGKDNFAADRESGDLIERAHPTARISALENRAFLQRAVRFLAADAGIDQFLDIGTGLPTADNTHEVAQRINPSSRIVYVDNDPMVMTHARALLTSTDGGRTAYLEEDLRNPGQILRNPELLATLDLDRPVALMLIAVLHFIPDHDQARAIVAELLDALPRGSFLAVSNFTLDYSTPEARATHERMAAEGTTDAFPRTADQICDFFDDLEVFEPGIVPVSDWRPTKDDRPSPQDVAIYGAVGRKF